MPSTREKFLSNPLQERILPVNYQDFHKKPKTKCLVLKGAYLNHSVQSAKSRFQLRFLAGKAPLFGSSKEVVALRLNPLVKEVCHVVKGRAFPLAITGQQPVIALKKATA